MTVVRGVDVGRPMVGGPIEGVELLGSSELLEHPKLRSVGNGEVTALVAAHEGRTMDGAWLDRMGVERRRWASTPGRSAEDDAVTTDELLAAAAAAAIESAGIDRRDVDLMIAATTTTSRLTTSMGAAAAGRLGMRCATFELRAGCASAAAALITGYAHAAIGAECIVVTAAETLSKVCPPTGPLPYLAGDGGGAAVLVRTGRSGHGMTASWMSADGSLHRLAGAPGELPPRQVDLDRRRYTLLMDRRFDEAAAPWWPIGPSEVLAASATAPGEVDAIVLNQANRPRLVETAFDIGVDAGSVVDVVSETANAGAASMMVALHRARSEVGDRAGDAGDNGSDGPRILVGAVGGGLSAASLLIRP